MKDIGLLSNIDTFKSLTNLLTSVKCSLKTGNLAL